MSVHAEKALKDMSTMNIPAKKFQTKCQIKVIHVLISTLILFAVKDGLVMCSRY